MEKKICNRFTWGVGLLLAVLMFAPTFVQAESTASFLPGETIAANLRVKLSGATVVAAGAAESHIGTTLSACTTANFVAVNLTADGEIGIFVASAAVAAGADVYPAAAGKVSSTASGRRIGKALNAAAADGDKIRVITMSTDVDRVVIRHTANAASVDDWVFVADRAYTVVSIKEVHSVAGGDGGAVTADVRKVTAVAAPGAAAGSTVKELLATAFDLKSTANTTVTGTLTATAADLDLAAGDKIGINFVGTLTALAGGVVIIELKVK